jgi:hypothetical protein
LWGDCSESMEYSTPVFITFSGLLFTFLSFIQLDLAVMVRVESIHRNTSWFALASG